MPKLEYMILETEGKSARTALEQLVNNAIFEGWEPQGGVAVCFSNASNYCDVSYIQAMTRQCS